MNYNGRKKKSPAFIVAVVLASIAVVLTSTVLVLKLTGKEETQIIQGEQGNTVEENVDPAEEEETPLEETSVEEMEEEEPVEEKLALKYVPEPGRILKFLHHYTDGAKGEEEEIIGEMDPGILVSKATMLPEERETLSIYHFVEGQEGIYLVQNDNPEDSILWLPNNPKVGDTWKDIYSEYKILEMGATVEAGGKTFENCIVRKNTTDIVEFVNISYIAPGYGEVYSVYQGGEMEFELIEERKDEYELAEDLMKDEIKYLEAILRYREK